MKIIIAILSVMIGLSVASKLKGWPTKIQVTRNQWIEGDIHQHCIDGPFTTTNLVCPPGRILISTFYPKIRGLLFLWKSKWGWRSGYSILIWCARGSEFEPRFVCKSAFFSTFWKNSRTKKLKTHGKNSITQGKISGFGQALKILSLKDWILVTNIPN